MFIDPPTATCTVRQLVAQIVHCFKLQVPHIHVVERVHKIWTKDKASRLVKKTLGPPGLSLKRLRAIPENKYNLAGLVETSNTHHHNIIVQHVQLWYSNTVQLQALAYTEAACVAPGHDHGAPLKVNKHTV